MEIKQFTDDTLKHVFEICTSTMNILELLGYEPYKIRGQKCKEILNIQKDNYLNLIFFKGI